MSIEATEWALCTAPKHPTATVRLVLLGLAKHAWKDGTGAYPSQGTLASYLAGGDNDSNRRKVRRALSELESGGWIQRGSQSKVKKIPKGRRPIVWDLNLDFVDLAPSTPGAHVQGERSSVSSHPGCLCPVTPDTGDQDPGCSCPPKGYEPLKEPLVEPLSAPHPRSEPAAPTTFNIFSKEEINQCDQCDDRGRKHGYAPHVRALKAICDHRKEHTA